MYFEYSRKQLWCDKGATHSTKISGLSFENFLGVMPPDGLVQFLSQKEFALFFKMANVVVPLLVVLDSDHDLYFINELQKMSHAKIKLNPNNGLFWADRSQSSNSTFKWQETCEIKTRKLKISGNKPLLTAKRYTYFTKQLRTSFNCP